LKEKQSISTHLLLILEANYNFSTLVLLKNQKWNCYDVVQLSFYPMTNGREIIQNDFAKESYAANTIAPAIPRIILDNAPSNRLNGPSFSTISLKA